MKIDKDFADINKQLQIQEKRKLIIHDEKKFKEYLLSSNYFEIINGFETLFLVNKDDKNLGYEYGTSFDDFVSLYNFDVELNIQIMKSLMRFERKLKARIAYHFCEKFCTTSNDTMNYLKKSYYDCPAVTTYSGKYFAKQYNNDSFVFLQNIISMGKKIILEH